MLNRMAIRRNAWGALSGRLTFFLNRFRKGGECWAPDMMEKRREARQLTLKTGKISALYLASDIDCAILDISEGGARLLVPFGAKVPASFDLTLDPGQDRYVCKVVWRVSSKLGVSFQKKVTT
jgi:hypothetical protein